MTKVAVIGTGIAGMACGYLLQDCCDLVLYEKNDYIGGHTHTVEVEEQGRRFPIDTGFIVYNEINYPSLTRLFRDLNVETKPASMSFSVQHEPSGLEYCGSGWSGLFAQRRNVLNMRFWALLQDIHRFNSESPEVLETHRYETWTVKAYAEEKGYGPDVLDQYLIPMSSAVWSTIPEKMLDFPIVTLVRFFQNHGFLGLYAQHPWRTVEGGSRQYRDKLIAKFKDRIRIGRGAVSIHRSNGKVKVHDTDGESNVFDRVIFACHADQALGLLAEPTALENELLSSFKYQKNTVLLHTDAAVMPKTRRAWSSWNYWLGVDARRAITASTVYYMNSLQGISRTQDYFLSINDPGRVRSSLRLRSIDYEHPIFSVAAIQAQTRLPELNQNPTTYFCGSYFGYGFHEDALVSAFNVCKKFGVLRTQL